MKKLVADSDFNSLNSTSYLLQSLWNGNGVQSSHNLIVYPFEGFSFNEGETYTAVNDVLGSDVDTGSVIISDADVSVLAGSSTALNNITYRQSDGTYKTEEDGFTSTYTSSSTYPSVKLAVEEIGGYYSDIRRMYEGTALTDVGVFDQVSVYF